MKAIIVVALLGIIGFCAYRYHSDHLRQASEEAASAARAKALADAAKVKKKPEPPPQPPPPPPPPPPPVISPIAISRVLEPLYVSLLSDISATNPVDYVPQLEITKERILDKRGSVESSKQPIYDAAGELLTGMIATAEERTKATEALLKAQAAKPNALDSKASGASTKSLFVQGAVNRWKEQRTQRKPALDAQFGKLRQAERTWNVKATPNTIPESFDLPDLPAPLVTLDPQVSYDNPLERPTRVMPAWRRSYYDRYGYPRSN